jgi:hypothetical protein
MQKYAKNQTLTKFIGTWKLLECIEIKNGGDFFYPWGKDAIGYIIYTVEGVIAVQIMRQNRQLFNGKDITEATPDEGQALTKDYNAYFGHFEIDEAKKTVIHHIEGHLYPNLIGKNNIRSYHFYDNKLALTTEGGNVLRKLVWEKLV